MIFKAQWFKVVVSRIGMHTANLLHCTYYGLVSVEAHGHYAAPAFGLLIFSIIEIVHQEKHRD